MTEMKPELELGHVVIPLLRGVLYQENDASLWNTLLVLRPRLIDYVAPLGLEIVLDEAEGYAYLRTRSQQTSEQESSQEKLPRLMVRRPLTFHVSLVLALLRKKLAEFDAKGGDTRLVLTREQLVEMVRVFLPEKNNEVRLIEQIDSHLSKIEDLGFVRKLKPTGAASKANTVYEVRRILKAFVDAQWLSEFDARLQAYQLQLSGPTDDELSDQVEHGSDV